MKKITIADLIFSALIVAKILHIGNANFSIYKLIVAYILFGALSYFVGLLFRAETAEKIAQKIYLARYKEQMKKAEKEAKNIIDGK